MRFRAYASTDGVENLFYDSESMDPEMAIVEPNLNLELSKAGTFEFVILPTHPMYDFFKTMKTYIRIMQDDAEIFRGRVLQIQDSTWKERDVKCEGDLAYLIDSYQPPQQSVSSNTVSTTTKSNDEYRSMYGGHVSSESTVVQSISLGDIENTSRKLEAQFRKYIEQHNSLIEVEKQFTVGEVTVDDVGTASFSSSSYRDTKNAIDTDLIDRYGGYLQTRKNQNGPTYIDWLKEPGITCGQSIVLGINLVDLQKKIEGDELFTIFVPIGDEDLTIESANDGSIAIEDSSKIAKYGKIYKTESYNGVEDPNELKKLAQDYMAANCKPEKLTFTIKAVDMSLLDGDIDTIKVGSTVRVVSDPHGIEVSLTCISIEYDIQNPENNSYEFGDPTDSLTRKSQLANREMIEASTSAGSRAGWASSAAKDLEETVNRHAENIIDQADKTYKLEADVAQIHAKCIEITAQEKVTITTDVLDINAKGTINLKSKGKLTMSSDAQINFDDTLYIGSGIDDYTLYNIGSAWMQELTIGGHLYIGDIEDENGAKWTTSSSLRDFYSIYSSSFIYTGGNTDQNIENAVKGFGSGSVSQSGVVSIPYFTFSGENVKAGDITFNMAATAFFTNSMAAEYARGWGDALNGVLLDPNSDTTISSKTTVTVSAYLTPTSASRSTIKSIDITPSGGGGGGGGNVIMNVPVAGADGTVNSTVKSCYTPLYYDFEWIPVEYSNNGSPVYGFMKAEFVSGTNAYNGGNYSSGCKGGFTTNSFPGMSFTFPVKLVISSGSTVRLRSTPSS